MIKKFAIYALISLTYNIEYNWNLLETMLVKFFLLVKLEYLISILVRFMQNIISKIYRILSINSSLRHLIFF